LRDFKDKYSVYATIADHPKKKIKNKNMTGQNPREV
jgi:hypothetical protein